MDLSDIRKLVRLMQQAELSELEIDDSNKGLRVHLKRRGGPGGGDGPVQPVLHVVPGAAPTALSPASLVATPAAGAGAGPGGGGEAAPAAAPAGDVFASPMVGTFYRSPTPDSEAFVEPGSQVTEDTVLCIIEAMKVMNEIKAELRGTIVEVLVENGEPVEFGQPLFVIKKG